MSLDQGPGDPAILSAVAAITGRSKENVRAAFREAQQEHPDGSPATREEVRRLIDRISTRLGLAPGVNPSEARDLRLALSSVVGDGTVVLTKSDLHAWDQLLRHAPEYVPTIDRDPVVLPVLPDYQTAMWTTLLDLERLGRPWVLVGGQMTLLHCLENGVSPSRSTDDADVVVGVWTRRDALRWTSAFLKDRAFVEDQTNDGYGYRFRRGRTVIDVLVPEGLERQRDYPRTTAGRPGFAAKGGNQALIRAERVPVVVAGSSGYLRRPNLLGAIVVKANAFVADSRDVDRHATDIVTLAGIALNDPRATLQSAISGDRRPVRLFLKDLSPTHRYFRNADDPTAAFEFLSRLAHGTS